MNWANTVHRLSNGLIGKWIVDRMIELAGEPGGVMNLDPEETAAYLEVDLQYVQDVIDFFSLGAKALTAVSQLPRIVHKGDVSRLVRSKYGYPQKECIWVLGMEDRYGRCRYVKQYATGNNLNVRFNSNQIIYDAKQHGVSGIILVHNHTSVPGLAQWVVDGYGLDTMPPIATHTDILCTMGIEQHCRREGIELYDHVILGPNATSASLAIPGSNSWWSDANGVIRSFRDTTLPADFRNWMRRTPSMTTELLAQGVENHGND